jgi:hypothetical protein
MFGTIGCIIYTCWILFSILTQITYVERIIGTAPVTMNVSHGLMHTRNGCFKAIQTVYLSVLVVTQKSLYLKACDIC